MIKTDLLILMMSTKTATALSFTTFQRNCELQSSNHARITIGMQMRINGWGVLDSRFAVVTSPVKIPESIIQRPI